MGRAPPAPRLRASNEKVLIKIVCSVVRIMFFHQNNGMTSSISLKMKVFDAKNRLNFATFSRRAKRALTEGSVVPLQSSLRPWTIA